MAFGGLGPALLGGFPSPIFGLIDDFNNRVYVQNMNPDSFSVAGVRRLRDRQRETTAQEILAATEQEIVEKGLHAITVADIAARAGLAVGTLYNHYKDRDALVSALAAQRKTELLEKVDAQLAKSAGKSFRIQLRDLFRTIFAHFDEHFQFFAAFTQAEAAPPTISQSAQVFQRELYERIAQLIERGKKLRAIRPKAAEIAPALLMGMTRSMMMRRIYVTGEQSPLAHVETLVDCFLHGVGGKTP